MSKRIIEIASNNRHLAVERGFMTVAEDHKIIARIPLDDIAAIISCAHGLTYSNNLLVQLAFRKAIFVICGSNFSPVAFLWTVEGHHQQSARIETQINSSAPKSKQLWKQIVRAKISQQAAILAILGRNNASLVKMIGKVRSGDPDNIEAQAARRYWPLVFGDQFLRDQTAGGINAMLNYGYTIIRSAMARSIMAAGLHPSIGIHHSNIYNPLRLVDDLMEPFRPFVDLAVYQLVKEGHSTVTPDVKARLVSLLDIEVLAKTGTTSFRAAIQNMAVSLAHIFEGLHNTLECPRPYDSL